MLEGWSIVHSFPIKTNAVELLSVNAGKSVLYIHKTINRELDRVGLFTSNV